MNNKQKKEIEAIIKKDLDDKLSAALCHGARAIPSLYQDGAIGELRDGAIEYNARYFSADALAYKIMLALANEYITLTVDRDGNHTVEIH